MGRASTSLLLVLLAVAGWGQAFGRFGYRHLPDVPGFDITDEGVRARFPAADRLYFREKLPVLKVQEVSERAALYGGVRRAANPQKLRVNLRSPGFELYFPLGIEFRTTALSAPYLSWAEGSVGADVPTPPVKWLLVSFRDRQPPVLLVFRDGPAALKVTGSAGDWRIRTTAHYDGWARMCLPMGVRPLLATTAGGLGEAVSTVTTHEKFWTQSPPEMTSATVRADDESVTAVWTFAAPGAVVPFPVLLAKAGGYPIQLLSEVKVTDAATEDGPVVYATSRKLAVRFPIRRVATGRAVAIGELEGSLIGTASPFDAPSVAELALENLLAGRDPLAEETAQSALRDYLAQAAYTAEPFTAQKLPYDAEGRGIDAAAAQALLMQALSLGKGSETEPNSLFTSVAWRRDWLTWRLWAPEPSRVRQAGAYAAVAGALSPEPAARLEAAMLEAGLAAERALQAYRRKWEMPPLGALPEPLVELRAALFSPAGPADGAGFAKALLSPLRTLSPYAVTARSTPKGVVVRWVYAKDGPRTLAFSTAAPLKAQPALNIASMSARETFGVLVVRFEPKVEGPCEVLLTWPSWAKALPPAASPTTCALARP